MNDSRLPMATQLKATAQDTIPGKAQRWIYDPNPALPGTANATHYFTFNAPVEATPELQCGRFVFTGVHVATAGGLEISIKKPFPEGCEKRPMIAQEKALLFMLLDLSSCLMPDNGIPKPPPIGGDTALVPPAPAAAAPPPPPPPPPLPPIVF